MTSLKKLTVSELKDRARSKGLHGYSKKKKDELICMLSGPYKEKRTVKRPYRTRTNNRNGSRFPTTRFPAGRILTHVTDDAHANYIPLTKLNWFSTNPDVSDRSFGRYKHFYKTKHSIGNLLEFDFSDLEGSRLSKFLDYAESKFGVRLQIKADQDMHPICDWGYNGFLDHGSIGGEGYPDLVLCGQITRQALQPIEVEDLDT